MNSGLIEIPVTDCTADQLIHFGTEGYRLVTVVEGTAIFRQQVRMLSTKLQAAPVTEAPKGGADDGRNASGTQ